MILPPIMSQNRSHDPFKLLDGPELLLRILESMRQTLQEKHVLLIGLIHIREKSGNLRDNGETIRFQIGFHPIRSSLS